MTWLFGKLKLWAAIAGAVVVAVAFAFFRGRSAGQDAAKAAQRKRALHDYEVAQKKRLKSKKLSEKELNKRLKKWQRPK